MAAISWSPRSHVPPCTPKPKSTCNMVPKVHTRPRLEHVQDKTELTAKGHNLDPKHAKRPGAMSELDLGVYDTDHLMNPSDHTRSARGIPVRWGHLSSDYHRTTQEDQTIPSCRKTLKRDLVFFEMPSAKESATPAVYTSNATKDTPIIIVPMQDPSHFSPSVVYYSGTRR